MSISYIMSYLFIINPKTNRKVNIGSKLGTRILKQYVNQLGGVIQQNLKSCSNKLKGKAISSGNYKQVYLLDCAKKIGKMNRLNLTELLVKKLATTVL